MARNTSRCPPIAPTGGDVIPFPVPAQSRTHPHLELEQVRFHAAALDRELQDLMRRDFRSAGEWAMQAATPIVRTDCIMDLLITATAARPAVTTDERRRQACISGLRDELQSALLDTAKSLARLGDRAAGAEERCEVLQKLPFHRMRYQHILGRLHELIEEPRGRDPADRSCD